ncbi:MAG: hypothetical protein NWF14_06095 [Candidatus Bathyarchaeota archaeon]|nr:hypothetical protein [Candidatus Bathyarchaeota archaeon]
MVFWKAPFSLWAPVKSERRFPNHSQKVVTPPINTNPSLPEKEVFSADVQIRKAGETRYGKGKIRITTGQVHLKYKKFLGKEQDVAIDREDIEKAEFWKGGLPIEIIGPGIPSDQSWMTLEIKLNNGGSYSIYVGQPQHPKKGERNTWRSSIPSAES